MLKVLFINSLYTRLLSLDIAVIWRWSQGRRRRPRQGQKVAD